MASWSTTASRVFTFLFQDTPAAVSTFWQHPPNRVRVYHSVVLTVLLFAVVQHPKPRRALRRLSEASLDDDDHHDDDSDTDTIAYRDKSIPKKEFKESISEPYLEGTSNYAFQPKRDPAMSGQNVISAQPGSDSGFESIDSDEERIRAFTEQYETTTARLLKLLNPEGPSNAAADGEETDSNDESAAGIQGSFECGVVSNGKARHASALSSESCAPVDPVRESRLRLLKWLTHEYPGKAAEADAMLEEALKIYSQSKSDSPVGDWLLQHFQCRLDLEHSGVMCSLDEMPAPCPSGFAVFSNEVVYQNLSKALEPWHKAIDRRLLPTWQTRMLTICGKWDVKNLAKWQDTEAVSQPIGGEFFALKTLRDVDPEHCPKVFAENWADKIFAIVDVSLDRPVYTPHDLEDGGIQYRKLPMVSKEQPSKKDVRDFVAVVDELKAKMGPADKRLIAVHCHYGFNRTGFLLVSYLAEKKIMAVDEGIEEFALKRKPRGIKHKWFLDELRKRYATA